MSSYIITSPLEINGTSISELFLEVGANSINVQSPSGLSSTYDFILPLNLGTQGQVLTLNSSLETIWSNPSTTVTVQSNIVEDTLSFTSSNTNYQIIPSMTLTPSQGTYYCNFSTYSDGDVECAIFVDGNIVNSSVRTGIGNAETIFLVARATVNGSQDIDVRARRLISGPSNYTIFQRTLVANRLS